ncbi:hypothetical protein SCP_1103100 [Sparassis crispa]|uniref:Uncharacterized protein n=1 Tax=Sparassis crispa TaxID=139825 RepID=A0A401GZP3_9APHY|nr:hypothetical protein SCP_1103100 [Sparassis crispa]GBE87633.1 hypothetical protein SCP_1103100 [Sparassis crispa]
MGWFSDDSSQADAYNQVTTGNKPEVSHELLAAAASFAAAKSYEDHVAKNGHPTSHAEAKELLAALSGGFIDRLVETKGFDLVDKEKAKRQAKEQAQEALANSGQYSQA